jgi:hypothetical protein
MPPTVSTPPPLKTETRRLKHVFTPQEIAEMNIQFRMADKAAHGFETEFDSVKASYKAKITEAESRKEKIGAELDAGFDHRDQNCVVVMDFKEGNKYFFAASLVDEKFKQEFPDPLLWSRDLALLVEPITDEDRQQELLAAEAKFECREEFDIFIPTENDFGRMVVGRLDGKWYSALDVCIGEHRISEKLADEQAVSKKSGSKKRFDQVNRTLKRFAEWLDEKLGREEAKGFKNAIELVKAEHSEREE